jgi:hypothetical protein
MLDMSCALRRSHHPPGTAERLDPLSAAVQSGYGRVLYRAHRFDEAIAH